MQIQTDILIHAINQEDCGVQQCGRIQEFVICDANFSHGSITFLIDWVPRSTQLDSRLLILTMPILSDNISAKNQSNYRFMSVLHKSHPWWKVSMEDV